MKKSFATLPDGQINESSPDLTSESQNNLRTTNVATQELMKGEEGQQQFKDENSQVLYNKDDSIVHTPAPNDGSNEMSNDIFNLNQFFNEQIENFVIVENSCEEQTNNLQVANSKAQGVSGGLAANSNQQTLKKSTPNLNNFSNMS